MTRFAKAAVEPTPRLGRGIESSTRMEGLMVSQGHRLFLHRRHRSLWELVIGALRRIRAVARPGRSKRSRAERITERLPSAVASATAAITIRVDDLGYETVVVQGEFGARQYREVFDALQVTRGNKVLDLCDAGISSDAFNALAASWRAPRGHVPRIAILLDFAHWVAFRTHAEPALESLATKDVIATVAYEQQTGGMGLASWFAGRPLPHNLPGVIDWLSTRWRPAPIWPLVLTALGELLQAHAVEDDAPALYADAASLSLRCGGAGQALAFAHEALRLALPGYGRIRCRAMRVLAEAFMKRGQTAEAAQVLENVIALAVGNNEPIEGAIARCQAGLHALRRDDPSGAVVHFRDGIALLRFDQPELQATLHHNLARALSCLGSSEAAHHAARALMLRANKQSVAAESDRMLLASIREGRIFDN